VIICLHPGGRVFFGDCCAYIAVSGANFLNIVKEPGHGKKCVQNCALKNCNCHVFLSLSLYIFFMYFVHFYTVASLRFFIYEQFFDID
jgi:hypothetical protein